MTELEKIQNRYYERLTLYPADCDSSWVIDMRNLINLTSIYEKELLNHVPVTYLDDIKKEVFKL